MATGLIVNVGADTTEFKQEIRELPKEFEKAEQEITQSAGKVNTAVGGLLKGLFSAGMLVAMERLINHFDKVADAASKYGETAEDIQRVGVAAEMSGSSIDSVAMAMERAGIAAAKAARGNEEFVEKFNRARIDPTAFAAATLSERVEMVAEAQRLAGDSGQRLAAVLEAIGDGAASIDFQRISEEMGDVAVASDDTVEKLSRANDMIGKGKNQLMVWGAEVMGLFGNMSEVIGSAAGGAGLMTIKQMEQAEELANAAARLRQQNKLFLDSSGNPIQAPTGFFETFNQTEEFLEKRRENERLIAEEVARYKNEQKEAEKASRLSADAAEELKEKLSDQREQRTKILELGLQIKEAEAAGNKVLADKLRYQEDIEKGILKYKDAEDAYGMAVREANAELAKRNGILNKSNSSGIEQIVAIRENYRKALAYDPKQSEEERKKAFEEYRNLTRQNPELLRIDMQAKLSDLAKRRVTADPIKQAVASLLGGGAIDRSIASAAMTEPERQRAEAATRSAAPGTATEADKIATETTLQKVANFLEQLNTKLPQPVLV